MISELKDINVKSFKHYSSSEKMGTANIIFGQNGSGKTSFAEWLATIQPMTRVFDTDYVKNNILANDSLGAVHLTIGEEAVNSEKNIQNVTEANENIQLLIQNKTELIKRSNDQLYSEMAEKLSEAKQKFSMDRAINQKARAKVDPMAALKMWYADIDTNITEVGSSSELEGKKQRVLSELSDLAIELPFDEHRFVDFSKSMNESVQIPNEAISNDIAQWIIAGTNFHDMHDSNQTCQFCGSTFNGETVAHIIFEKTNSAHAKLIKALEKMKGDLLRFDAVLEKLPFPDVIAKLSEANHVLINAVNQKIENTVQTISIEEDYWNLLIELESKIQELKKSKNESLRDINKQLARIELVAKSWIGQALKADQSVQLLVNTIKKTQDEMDSLRMAYTDNLKWITETHQEESNLNVFMNIANSELMKAGFGFELRIDAENNNYTVWHNTDNIQLRLSQLSEGERRFIAFIHFYYDLFKVPEEQIADGISTVIIDDPITSLDSDNRFYLTELINGFIKFAIKSNVQIVILTHSSQDFHNFAYGSGKDTKWFRIVKDEQGKSSVESVGQEEKNNYSDYYRTTFESLMSFAQLSKRKLNESHLSYGNKARVIFESHAKSHYKLMYATNASYPEIKKFYEIPDELDADVQRMLDVINSLSHGLTIIDDLDISPKELQTNVRTLLHLLWLKDEQHVLQMVGNKINRENRKDTMEWLS